MQSLTEYLASLQPGPVPDPDRVEDHLAYCWDDLTGSGEEGMAAYKLRGRMEEVSWDPPLLSFTIERHGAYALGSSRAELQRWTVDVDAKSASCETGRYRQIIPRQPRLDVRPIAEEIAGLIIERQHDVRLKWNNDGSVRVKVGMIIPKDSATKQTLAGRRKRLRLATEELLSQAGWQKIRANVYAPPAD